MQYDNADVNVYTYAARDRVCDADGRCDNTNAYDDVEVEGISSACRYTGPGLELLYQ